MPKPNLYNYNGQLYTLKEISQIYGIKPYTFLTRVRNGWSVEKAIDTKPRAHKKYLYKGQYYSVGELSKLHGNLSPHGIQRRFERGMTIDQVMTMPKQSGGVPYSVNPKVKKQVIEPKPALWKPHRSEADMAKCKKCRYSEKDSGGHVLCMYLDLHDPPERRGCEPGKNCKKFEPKTKKSDKMKLAKWIGGIKNG